MTYYQMGEKQFYRFCKKFVKSGMSIRQFCGTVCPMARSTFHKAIHDELPSIDKKLYIEICKILNHNHKYRHSFTNGKNLKGLKND